VRTFRDAGTGARGYTACMSYRLSGLSAAEFSHLAGLTDGELAAQGAMRYVVDEKPGFPCRITLEDADPGESVLLLNYEHQPAPTPYRSAHAIFVREGALETAVLVDRVPESLRVRELSVRAFDAHGMMLDADVVDGERLEPLIERMFADPSVAYLHVHNAKRGCYAARVDRG
jgi:hypothetical protein